MSSISPRFGRDAGARRVSKATAPRGHRLICIARPRLFDGLSISDCVQIVSFAEHKRFLPTQTIPGQDIVAHFISLLVRGRAKTMRLSRGGVPVIVRIEQPGDVVGALGLPSDTLDLLRVQALETCQVLAWEAQTFEVLCEHFPALRHNSVQILDERLRLMEERFLELATENAASRLARMLIRLLQQNGSHREAARIGFSNDELAQMTGTTPFTVNRLLSDWQQRGIIQRRHKAVLVQDRLGLIDLASTKLQVVS
ncbi:MAG TPA: Crp/Fnr family transcriptional regulator [Terriglobales bacterium]|jgi:CRP/FNR family transcriptional regulator, nitrogen oxide reductase regulator|nr:Crp/Fnr family transcriptional regulator [Terriglobales bacterium]